MNPSTLTANGQPITVKLTCTLEEFLVAQGLLRRSIVVEHHGVAGAVSKLATLQGWALALSSGHVGLE